MSELQEKPPALPFRSLNTDGVDSQQFFHCKMRIRNSFSDMATSSIKLNKLPTVKWSDLAWDK